MKTEIVVFLNCYLGGCIYVGVGDNGQLFEIADEEKDIMEPKVINWIRDEAIFPNSSEFVDVSFNQDGVLEIHINPGTKNHIFEKRNNASPKH